MTANNLRAEFALYYTYSFLPVRSESKTCQEQVSPRLSKMNLCPPALVGDFAPQSLESLCAFRRGSCLRQSQF